MKTFNYWTDVAREVRRLASEKKNELAAQQVSLLCASSAPTTVQSVATIRHWAEKVGLGKAGQDWMVLYDSGHPAGS